MLFIVNDNRKLHYFNDQFNISEILQLPKRIYRPAVNVASAENMGSIIISFFGLFAFKFHVCSVFVWMFL